MKSYGEFALLYDELMDDFDYVAWGEYVQDILKSHGFEKTSILEMACGTGNLTEELLKRGHSVDGFDLSQEMLAIANNKLFGFKKKRLFKMDMEDFKLDRKYKVVISACDSINYILEDSNLRKTFANVYGHLEDDGIFIFDINSEYKLREILGNNIFIEDRDNVFYTWENHFDEDSGICEFYLTFFQSGNGIDYRRFDEYHRERAYSVETVRRLLEEAGFSEISAYEAFGFQDVGHDSERINFVVKK